MKVRLIVMCLWNSIWLSCACETTSGCLVPMKVHLVVLCLWNYVWLSCACETTSGCLVPMKVRLWKGLHTYPLTEIPVIVPGQGSSDDWDPSWCHYTTWASTPPPRHLHSLRLCPAVIYGAPKTWILWHWVIGVTMKFSWVLWSFASVFCVGRCSESSSWGGGRGQCWGCGVVADSCLCGPPLDFIVRLFVVCVCVCDFVCSYNWG